MSVMNISKELGFETLYSLSLAVMVTTIIKILFSAFHFKLKH